MLTELSSVEGFLSQAVERASAGEWDAADEFLVQASAILDRLIASALQPVAAVELLAIPAELPQPALIEEIQRPAIEVVEARPRAFAAAA